MSLGVTLHLSAIWVEVAVDQGRGQCSLQDDNSPPIEKTTAANNFFAKT